MKAILISLSILFCSLTQAQIKISATRQQWAGGVCCVTGTNYVITINGQTDSLNNSEFLYAVIDGHKFTINKAADTSPIKTTDKTTFNFHFGVRNNQRDDIYHEEIEIFEGAYVLLILNGKEIQVPIDPITDLWFLAYP